MPTLTVDGIGSLEVPAGKRPTDAVAPPPTFTA